MICGIQNLIHLDFETAYKYNLFTFIVLLLIVFLIIIDFVTDIKKKE